jgi:asparagine synthase (glutamine-hydrolysing)
MCGIAGEHGLTRSDEGRRMLARLAHRGPDDQGEVQVNGSWLGHRRLSIVDVATGHQPLVTSDKGLYLVGNGEVYNHEQVREWLTDGDYATRSDNEVALHLIRERGPEALGELEGMFAFLAAGDDGTFVAARDAVGIKPLYWARVGDTLLFGSEVKAFIAHGAYRPEMDREALLEYFTFQNFLTDRTLFAGVHLLPPGAFMRVRRHPDAKLEEEVYWDFRFEEPETAGDKREYLEELDRLFVQAVSRQLVSDVPVSSYLSGGMDSGSISAVASRQLPNLRTFTVGFDLHSASGIEMQFDERERAEYLSYLLHTEHYEMVLKAGDMERAMAPLVWHLEEPRVGQSYPNYYAAQLASKFGKVVLGGTGGDELFGGYPWRYYRAVVNDDFEHYVDKYYVFWQRLIQNKLIRRAFRPIWDDVSHIWTRDLFRDVFADHAEQLTKPEDYINHSLYFEARTFLHGLLVVEDKLSMAHGLESRVPFLDNDLVDFAQRLPVSLKLGNLGEVVRLNENDPGPKTQVFFEQTRDGKLILREMMERHVPAEITQRVKQGFSAPDASWFRGESIDYVRRVLFEEEPLIYAYLDADVVRELVEEHVSGRESRRLLIWSLLCVEQWCRTFLAGQRPAAAPTTTLTA